MHTHSILIELNSWLCFCHSHMFPFLLSDNGAFMKYWVKHAPVRLSLNPSLSRSRCLGHCSSLLKPEMYFKAHNQKWPHAPRQLSCLSTKEKNLTLNLNWKLLVLSLWRKINADLGLKSHLTKSCGGGEGGGGTVPARNSDEAERRYSSILPVLVCLTH